MGNTGFRIYNQFERPPRSLVDAFSGIPVANIADNMNRTFCIGGGIRPYNVKPLIGSAFTVKTRPGDNLLLNKAIDMASPGDIIVVEAQGDTTNALMGELMVAWAQNRGIAGFVIDGAIRDAGVIRQMTMPVYAAGVTPAGPYKDGPGEINSSISCGGVTVRPGDILIGDEDGVVVINPKDAREILENARKTVTKEEKVMAGIRNGIWDRTWIDKTLRDKGCEFVDCFTN
ncbi:RraA family protein [Peribacillus butanolivorans]|uniref:RraA family protein n=1 Tax=Peribacillus butanolivorans TaxID=421767 RepID=UPI00207D0866|nr:RraA family protein [Peribacillus butanolivorans]MCO0599975.1 RraA family protein [Peribacillus butanolivorans]